MNSAFASVLLSSTALLTGGVIGLAFGIIQENARRRNERLQQEGKFTSVVANTPGSFRRVAYLLVALALVQFICPMLFQPGSISQYLVSAGLVVGYGSTLYRQMRRRVS